LNSSGNSLKTGMEEETPEELLIKQHRKEKKDLQGINTHLLLSCCINDLIMRCIWVCVFCDLEHEKV
ncbi:hypothetical protein XENOCAPTIV_008319, partial [Xenoophorus captivus]